jgi:hypothetical protein
MRLAGSGPKQIALVWLAKTMALTMVDKENFILLILREESEY